MKSATLHIRLRDEHKSLIEQAASLKGLSLTDYVGTTVLADARASLENERGIRISVEEFARFQEAIANPPAPNDALRAAATEYRQGYVVGERFECDL